MTAMQRIIEAEPMFQPARSEGPLAKFVKEVVEKYARKKPAAGQSSLWTEEDEAAHPRAGDGKWTEGEWAERKKQGEEGAGGKEKVEAPIDLPEAANPKEEKTKEGSEVEAHRVAHKFATTLVGNLSRNGYTHGHEDFSQHYNGMEEADRKAVVADLKRRGLLSPELARKRNLPHGRELVDDVLATATRLKQQHEDASENRHVPFEESDSYREAVEPSLEQIAQSWEDAGKGKAADLLKGHVQGEKDRKAIDQRAVAKKMIEQMQYKHFKKTGQAISQKEAEEKIKEATPATEEAKPQGDGGTVPEVASPQARDQERVTHDPAELARLKRQRLRELKAEEETGKADAAPLTPPPELPPASDIPSETPKAKAARKAMMEDFGEKIGGARKDEARKLGPRIAQPKEKDNRPGWARRYQIQQIAASSNESEVGKWTIVDTKSLDWFKQPRQIGKPFDSEEDAKRGVPLAEVARSHGVSMDRGSVRQLTEEEKAAMKKVAEDWYESKRAWNAARNDAANRGEDPDTLDIGPEPKPPPPLVREGETYHIYRKVSDRKRPVVKGGFKTMEEAHRYMAAHPEELIEHEFPRYETYQYLDHVQREGGKQRQGDVKCKKDDNDFQKAFGFRGGTFGNWESGKDGQTSLNHAYDALHDLSDMIGLPPKAMSLNGDLAIGFGSHGHGGKDAARAHYESNERLINLTKMRGAGSLAHEWTHAFDDYFGREAAAKPGSAELVSGRIPYNHKLRPEVAAGIKKVIDTMMAKHSDVTIDNTHETARLEHYREHVADRIKEIEQGLLPSTYRKVKPFTPQQQKEWDEAKAKLLSGDPGESKYVLLHPDKQARGYSISGYDSYTPLEEMNKLYKTVTGRSFHTSNKASSGHDLYWSINRSVEAEQRVKKAAEGATETRKQQTEFLREARKLDETRASDYYALPHEMFARAFESYVADKLDSNGRRNDYLVGKGKTNNANYRIYDMMPFPEGDERKAIHSAMDELFAVLKQEVRDGGHIHLYRREGEVLAIQLVERYQRGQPGRAGPSMADTMQRQMVERYARDANGAEHKGPGEGGGQFTASGDINPSKLTPLHGVHQQDKLKQLTASMKVNGWRGRPLVATRAGDELQAWTGSHRIAASIKAELDTVPVVSTDYDDLIGAAEELGYDPSELIEVLTDDADRAELFEKAAELNPDNDNLQQAAQLMRAEVEERTPIPSLAQRTASQMVEILSDDS